MNLPSWKAVGLRTGDMLELGLGSLNVSVACQFGALSLHFLAVYHLVTVVDSCCITRSHVFPLGFFIPKNSKIQILTRCAAQNTRNFSILSTQAGKTS